MATKIPPRWLMRIAWTIHRSVLSVSGARIGLSRPVAGRKTGMLRLHTVGRKSGRPRPVVLNYIEDRAGMVTLAGNAGAPADPAWLLNLRARPEAVVDLDGGGGPVHAREATGDERERLLAALRGYPAYAQVDEFLAVRGGHTAVVVLAPPA